MSVDDKINKLDTTIEYLVSDMFYAMRRRGSEVAAMVHMVWPDEDGTDLEHAAIVLPGKPGEHADELRELAAEKGAVWLAFTAEVWMGTPTKDPDSAVRPSEDPNRREALMLLVEGPTGARMVTWCITDDKLGKPEINYDYEGRLSHLLPRADTTKLN